MSSSLDCQHAQLCGNSKDRLQQHGSMADLVACTAAMCPVTQWQQHGLDVQHRVLTGFKQQHHSLQ